MAQLHESTASAKEDLQGMKKDIQDLIQRLGSLKDKGGDVMAEQLDHLSDTISDIKNQGKRKGKEVAENVLSSTKEHPARNLGIAFGLGVLLTLILK